MTDQPTTELAQLRNRLRLAHQARRAKEHQLDDIRRALCDAGFMQDDDPYSHADLADVIRQTAPAEPTKPTEPDTVTDPAWLCQQYAKAIAADDGHPWDTLPADRQEDYLDNADAVLRVRDRHLDQLRRRLELTDAMRQQDLDAAAAAIQRADRAEAALARVRALHYQDGAYCAICTENFGRLSAPWPCPTVRALDEPAPGTAATQATERAARDREMQQLAAARDELAGVLAAVLSAFPADLNPAGPAVHSRHVPAELLNCWRTALDQPGPAATAATTIKEP